MPHGAREEEKEEMGLEEGGRFRSPPQMTGGGRETTKEVIGERERGSRGWWYDMATESVGPSWVERRLQERRSWREDQIGDG